jgi:pimeloyl-ACP methyl ester carboxylesterase
MQIELDVEGARIVFDDEGQGPAVLLLHGFPATSHLWAKLTPPMVALGFRTLTPDLIGYGASRVDEGVSIDMRSQAHWMLRLLEILKIQTAIIIAHDVGSAVAQLMLSIAPNLVRGLVILDGAYEREWAMDSIASIITWDPTQASRLQPVLVKRLGKGAQMRQMLAAYEGDEGGRRLIRAAADLQPEQTAGFADVLRAANKPALVIWGEHDSFLSLDTVGRPLAEALNAPLVIVPGGHFCPIDCPQEVWSALETFLRGFQQ